MKLKSKKIGIIGHGNDQWVAGVLYIKSLIVGRFLLNNGSTSLFLHKDYHNNKDYAGLSHMVESASQFDYFYGSGIPAIKRVLTAFNRYFKNKRPLFPENNLPAILAEKEIEVIFPANALMSKKYSDVKIVCWIPDFQDRHFPENFTLYERLFRKYSFKRMVRIADKIIVSNAQSYADACTLEPRFSHKFAVLPFTMYLGEHWRLPDPLTICSKYNLNEDFLMFPSQFWKHKNHLTLFEAILILKNRNVDVTLVSTGLFSDPRFPKHSEILNNFIISNNLQKHIRILGLLPREDQVQLMRQAKAIVQPSLFEGWSALLEDCRSLGKTVFVSEIEMHKEQMPDHAIYFDPKSPAQLADLIEKHWPILPSGINHEREEIGEKLNISNLKNFAAKFSEICNSIE